MSENKFLNNESAISDREAAAMEKGEKTGKITAVSLSKEKGVKKTNVQTAVLKEDFGIVGDGHAGTKNRQVSLLAVESIKKIREKGLKVKPGDFAENITTEGIDLLSLKIGDRLRVGKAAVLEISQIGKECHNRCHIYYKVGDCVMPKEGIFAKVIQAGEITVGGTITRLEGVIPAQAYTAAVLTISDSCSRGERDDLSGKAIADFLKALPLEALKYEIIPDDPEIIKAKLIDYADNLKASLVLTTGGTGFSARDNTPEATKAVLDREIPGIPEIMRVKGLQFSPRSILSRGACGLRGRTLIINLPGSPKAVSENLALISDVLIHALDMVCGKGH